MAFSLPPSVTYPGAANPTAAGPLPPKSPGRWARAPSPASLRSRPAGRWTELACWRWCAPWATPSRPPWLQRKAGNRRETSGPLRLRSPPTSTGRIPPDPIGGDQHSRSANQTCRYLDSTRAVRDGEEGEDASGSGDRLLSDARRPGSYPGPRRGARRGRAWKGRGWGSLLLRPQSSLRLNPGSTVAGSGSGPTGDCGASIRYLFSRESPRPHGCRYSQRTDAEERGGNRCLSLLGVSELRH